MMVGRIYRLIPAAARFTPALIHSNNIARWVAPTLWHLRRRENKLGGKKIYPRNQFLEWNMESELYGFGKRLGEEFDQDLLLQAFTERSYIIEEESKQKEMNFDIKLKDNRQLADEGTKFMKDYIQLYLEYVLPRLPMEAISSIRNHLLSEAVLAHVSLNLGTKDIIQSAEYPPQSATLANTLAAIVGALLRSSNEERTAHFVRDFVITQLQGQDLNDLWVIADPYATLCGILKKRPEPRLIGETGRNTLLACYRVGLYIDKKNISSGFGESVRVAEEMAVREALKKLFGTTEHICPINFRIDGFPKHATEQRYQISSG